MFEMLTDFRHGITILRTEQGKSSFLGGMRGCCVASEKKSSPGLLNPPKTCEIQHLLGERLPFGRLH
jgi:hypothetical protein